MICDGCQLILGFLAHLKRGKFLARRRKTDGIALSREGIVDAALNVVRRTSLDDLTTSAIGEELGVSQPAVYHHFRNRDQLVSNTIDVICNEIADKMQTNADLPWFEAAQNNVQTYSDELQRYPGVANHILIHGPYTHGGRRMAEVWMSLFKRAGLSDEDAVLYTYYINLYALGFFSWYDSGLEVGRQRNENTPLRLLKDEDFQGTPLARVFVKRLADLDPLVRLDGGLDLIISGIRDKLESVS